MLVGPRDLGDRRPLRAPPGCRRDRRADRPQAAAGASTPGCGRSSASASSSPTARRASQDEVVDRQLRGALAGQDAVALTVAGLVVAYEPVWAIGTGRNASGTDAATMAGAIRGVLGRIGWEDRRRTCLSSTAAASRRRTSGNSSPSRRSTARSSVAPRSSRTRWRASSRVLASPLALETASRDGGLGETSSCRSAPPDRPRGPRWLRDRDRPGGRRDRRGADADVARRSSKVAALDPAGVGGRRRPAARPDGQLRGRPPQPGCRPAGPPGPAPDRRGDRRRHVLRRDRPSSRRATRRARPDGRLHIVGLIGPGGVHAHDRHLVAVAELAAAQGVPTVRVHALLDGRDTPPSSALAFVADLERRLAAVHPDARIATVGGRYWAMDRDRRWDRDRARLRCDRPRGGGACADARRQRSGPRMNAARPTSSSAPTVIDGVDGRIRDGEAVIHANFRADRARQLTHALADRRSTASTGLHRRPARAARHPGRDDDRVRGGPAGRGRVPARGGPVPGRGLLGSRMAAVPRRRDREVRPRHVLLQRRRRGAVARRGPPARSRARGSRPTTWRPR